jgi:hypothetical protein
MGTFLCAVFFVGKNGVKRILKNPSLKGGDMALGRWLKRLNISWFAPVEIRLKPLIPWFLLYIACF